MRILIVEDEAGLVAPAGGGASATAGYAVDCGRRRRARRLPRPDGKLRRRAARPRAAAHRRPDAAARLARVGPQRSGAGADRARQLARDGGRASTSAPTTTWRSRSGWRKCSPGCAALIRRASGQPQQRAALRRRHARSAAGARDARRRAGQADEPRVPRALVPDAPPRPRRLAGRADRAHLRAGLRSRLEHRRGVRRAAAAQARRRRSSRPSAGSATGSDHDAVAARTRPSWLRPLDDRARAAVRCAGMSLVLSAATRTCRSSDAGPARSTASGSSHAHRSS